MKAKSVPERLAALGKLNLDRGKAYGRYDKIGDVMAAYFPDGITLRTADEFTRFSLFLFMANKLVRLSGHLPGGIHEDSVDDVSVYAQILREFEELP